MKQGGRLLQHSDQGSTGKQFQIGQYLIITGTPCMNLFTGFPTLSGEEAFYLRMDVDVYKRQYQYNNLKKDSEYFVKVQFLLKHDMPWARKGFVVAEEQIQVKEAHRPLISTMIRKGGKLTCDKSRTARPVIQGNNFKVEFDESTGTIYSLTCLLYTSRCV